MRRTGRISVAARSLLLALALLPAGAPALADDWPSVPVSPGGVVINEVDVAQDWVELVNTGSEPVDLSGYVVKDDDDGRTLAVTAGTTLPPGGYLTVDTKPDGVPEGFGLGKSDMARLYAADGVTLLDSYSWAQEPATSYGRCADGLGGFVVQPETTKGGVNRCAVTGAEAVVVNEVESEADTGDWIELHNPSTVPADVSGYLLKDDTDSHVVELPAGTSIPAGGFLAVDTSASFGLGGADSARLFTADGATLVDAYTWTTHATTSYGRCPDGTGELTTTATPTKGAANDCSVPQAPAPASVVINEVESNGDDTDWVELMNTGDEAIDLSGYYLRDNDDSRTDRLVDGTVLAAGALMVLEGETATDPDFTFGLGGADEVRLFAPDGVTSVASYAWVTHATVTYGRCPDGTGEFATTSASTKGAPNDCRVPVRINEIESSDGGSGDWVELVNVGALPVDLAGYLLGDSDDSHRYALPAGTTVAAGARLVLDEADFGFGLGAGDSARLLTADGRVVDEYSWSAHAATTFGRCPDGTGEFTTTAAATKGAGNECAGIVTSEAWPGGTTVRALDAEGTFAGDLSGIDYEPSGSAAQGVLWAVQNGDGLLYRIVPDGSGGWSLDATDGWADGKTLAYPSGTGPAGSVVDAEGVTLVADDPAQGVYVSSERDGGAASGVSRPSVLRYDVTGTGATLTATHEWNLAPDFPGLGANAGLEGITWIPDSFLVAEGFVDATTGSAYQPARYPGHGSGLFFVGVEGTAAVYAYALGDDGGFARVATVGTGLALVADVQFDADRGALWVVCDEACDGRIELDEIGPDGTFATTHVYDRPSGAANLANEGFALAPQAECTGGTVATFYVDDAATDGRSLRTGTLTCETAPTDPSDPAAPEIPEIPEAPAVPVLPGTSAPVPVDPATMTETARGTVVAPASVAAGTRVAIAVGIAYAGQAVDVWLYSTPVHLGRVVVDAAGYAWVTLPVGTPTGTHRVAVAAADGSLIGWDDLTVTAALSAGSTRLAATGAEPGGAVAVGLALLAVGVGLLVLRRIGRA